MSTGDTPPPGWQPNTPQNAQQPPPGQPPPGQPPYGQPQYGQPQYGQPQSGPQSGPQYSQPQYGQPYVQPPFTQPQFAQPGYDPGGRPPGGSRGTWAWLIGGVVVLVAAVVVIVAVLSSGGSKTSPTAAKHRRTTTGTSTPSRSGAGSSSGKPSATTSGSSASAPTDVPSTDPLPDNSGTSSCSTKGFPDLVTVSVTTVLHLTPHGSKPNSYVTDVLRDCTSAAVRSRINALDGIDFGYETGSDLTGRSGEGATAEYRMHTKQGGTLDVTLTRQQDGHYEVTAYTYKP